nr:restriction endonuclease subunit S [Acinetobacter nosocomialis]
MAVPKLRFKEFDESWSQVILDDLAGVERGKFSVRPRNDPRYFGGKMPFVQTGDVTGSDVYLKGFSQTLNEDGIKVSKVFPEDTILITIAANIGDTTITQYPVACPDSVVAIQSKKDKANTLFLKNLIDLQKEVLDSQATQNAQKNINLQVLKPLELFAPSIEEQTKIASFLSAVDEKISQLTQKHELLSQYKQGMMQKLFSQQIRFKADDGSEFGEWEEKGLKDFIINHVGGAALTPNDFVSESEYEVIPKKAITFNGKLSLDENSPTYCTKSFFEENLKNTVNKDYLITVLRDLVPSGPSIGYIVQFQNSKTYILAQGVYGFQITSNLNKEFLIHFSNTKQYRLVMKSIMVGSTQVHIRNQDFFSIEIPLPCLEEQTKIANFLSAIDQKIEFVAQQIEQAKQWKKGLLQQMFV